MWLALAWFVSKAQWFWRHKPDLQFGWLVLLLSAFVIWDQWAQRPERVFHTRWPSVLFGLLGCGMLFLVQIYQAAYGMMAALLVALCAGVFAVAAANLHYVYAWKGVRFFAFPILFLAVALPLPSFVHGPVVNGLQHKVATMNVEILNILGVPAQRLGSLIQLPNGTVGVDEACSGIRSLQSTVMATLFIGYLTLKNRGFQVALFAGGVLLAVIGNVVRSLYLSLTANAKGVEAIKDHDAAGWSVFLFTAAGVALLAWLFAKLEKWLERQAKESPQPEAIQQATKA